MKKMLAVLMLMLSTSVMADAKNPQPGTDFTQTIQTIPTDNPAKIEVMEIFWYGCPHCYAFDPVLDEWVKKLPADVYFKRVPGIPRADWVPMAKAYYTLESLGIFEKLHTPLFEAIHKQKVLRPNDEAATVDWITKQSGMDRKKVEEAYNSFSINTKLNRAGQIFRASGATGVPSLVVDGKYITSSTMAGGNQEALKVTDFIIDNVRKDRAAKK